MSSLITKTRVTHVIKQIDGFSRIALTCNNSNIFRGFACTSNILPTQGCHAIEPCKLLQQKSVMQKPNALFQSSIRYMAKFGPSKASENDPKRRVDNSPQIMVIDTEGEHYC